MTRAVKKPTLGCFRELYHLFRALDELQRDGKIEHWSYRRKADGKWTFTLQPAEIWKNAFRYAVLAAATACYGAIDDQGAVQK